MHYAAVSHGDHTIATSTKPAVADAHAAKLSIAHPGFYRPELDILRFFAFLGVFLFHAFTGSPVIRNGPAFIFFANRLNYAGVFGVDLFFVLSAYLITELLLREKREFGRCPSILFASHSPHLATLFFLHRRWIDSAIQP